MLLGSSKQNRDMVADTNIYQTGGDETWERGQSVIQGANGRMG